MTLRFKEKRGLWNIEGRTGGGKLQKGKQQGTGIRKITEKDDGRIFRFGESPPLLKVHSGLVK